VILTVGIHAVNSLVKDIPGTTNEEGFVETDDYFRIKTMNNGKVFAFKDCSSLIPEKVANHYLLNF
jgi:NADH dehydrogenase FAD-containing subunit